MRLLPLLLLPPTLRQTNKPATRQLLMPNRRGPNLPAPAQSKLRPPWWLPSLPNPWWLSAATTVLAKSAPKRLPGAMADVMAALASAARAPVVTADQALADLATVALNAAATVLAIARPAKTEAHASEMPLSVPNAKHWSVLKCRCANWLHRHTARPWAA